MTGMPAAVRDRPERASAGPGSPDDDPYHHLYCCDPDTALCGLDVSGYADNPDDDAPLCPLCALADDEGLPCPVPGCEG